MEAAAPVRAGLVGACGEEAPRNAGTPQRRHRWPGRTGPQRTARLRPPTWGFGGRGPLRTCWAKGRPPY